MVGFGRIYRSQIAFLSTELRSGSAGGEILVDIGARFAYKEALDQKVLRTYERSGNSF